MVAQASRRDAVDRQTQIGSPEAEYLALAQFRRVLRTILAESEQVCAAAGLTTQRFQALLAIRTFPGGAMSVGDLAEELVLRHHSAVELVTRLEQAGLLRRVGDPQDRRRVLLALTAEGESRLEHLAREHLSEMVRSRDTLIATLSSLHAGQP